MADFITDRDPIQHYSGAPTHPRKPRKVQQAFDTVDAAWADYRDAVNDAYDGTSERNLPRLEHLLATAVEAGKEYSRISAIWSLSLEECRGFDGNPDCHCDVCMASYELYS